jgi:hypothetical protein
MSVTAGATGMEWSRRAFNQAGFTRWSTAAAGGLYHAIMARTPIFVMGSAIRPARYHGSIRPAARVITFVETAITKCGSLDR